MEIVINGTRVETERDLHEALNDALDFGEFYGWNVAALRDRLTTDVERPIHLVWENASDSAENLGHETFGYLCALFAWVAARDARLEKRDRFTIELR